MQFVLFALCLPFETTLAEEGISLEGVHVVPHVQSTEMRYGKKADFSLGARVEIFLRNTSKETLTLPASTEIRLRGQTPSELLKADEWAWHDLPSAWTDPLQLPQDALTVWSWNGKRAPWGVGKQAELTLTLPNAPQPSRLKVSIDKPDVWLSAVTFLGEDDSVQPSSMSFHVANESEGTVTLVACRLWLPKSNATWRALVPQPWIRAEMIRFPQDGMIPAHERGGARVSTGPLPLTYAALEVQLTDAEGQPITAWSHQRIKREIFDISGGWVADKLGKINALQAEPYLKTLRRMHVNAGMHQEVPGYSDSDLFERYPLKYMNRLQPIIDYDTDVMLPRIHAVEFLGEPQYGGGTPVSPQDVWKAFTPYAPTRLPTSVTHSEERIWRFYAGLSDYPHYDAYRVTAPAADSWSRYDRWDGELIRWGAPLETIGEMSRSLRELNRPRPVAYWSQGAHHGWRGYGGRERSSPTPDELRLQAYHGLSSRITSLYWFNLSLRSILAYPDLMDPITRVGREIRMLEDYYLEGDATHHERILRDGKPDWDLDVIAGPRGAVLFALDLNYRADKQERVFKFGAPRDTRFQFRIPTYLNAIDEVFRVDADGLRNVDATVNDGTIVIHDEASRVAIYVAAAKPGERTRIETNRQALIAAENALDFDPGGKETDLQVLRKLHDSSTK
jgi:hypothetical protein